jgi:hypothetical protein
MRGRVVQRLMRCREISACVWGELQKLRFPNSIQCRDRPAKQVRRIPQVEPILIEQGFSSYTWLGVLGPPVRKA